MTNKINAPGHYTYGERECIEFIHDIGAAPGYLLGNTLKYLYRHSCKGDPKGDIKKAIRCLEMYLKELDNA
jgi:hypothetical protein